MGHKLENKLGLSWAKLSSSWDWTLIVCRFGFSGFSFYFIGLIEKIWFGILGSLHFKHFAMLHRFNFVDFFCRLGLVDMVQ